LVRLFRDKVDENVSCCWKFLRRQQAEPQHMITPVGKRS